MFEILLFFITIIFTGYVFTRNKSELEKFQTNSVSATKSLMSTSSSSILPLPTTQPVVSTTSSKDLDEMEEIDFSMLNDLEKNKRDENSVMLQNCLSKFSNNKRGVLRDVAELMNKKDDFMNEATNNIYAKTEVVGNRYNQLGFW